MPITNSRLRDYVDDLLQSQRIRDYCPNGLQVEGRTHIHKIVTGVTASQALIDEAIAGSADAIIVHHGYFWKNEDARIVGMKYRRLAALIKNEINLFAYHLPLDVHPHLGNNAQLARLLDIRVSGTLEPENPQSVVMCGELSEPMSAQQFGRKLEAKLGRKPLIEEVAERPLKSLAWCTGGGQGYIEQAADAGFDGFITGEVSEQTIHVARERGIHFFAAGHHATERYGVKALGKHIAEQFEVNVQFIDCHNPA